MFDDRKCLRGDAVPTVFIECFVQSSEFVELSAHASPLTSTCDTDTTAASSLTTALQWHGDAVKAGIVTVVASSSMQHSRTADIASVDEDGNKDSQKQISLQNKDHTYYRRLVRVTKKKKTVNNGDHNYLRLVPTC